MKKCANPNCRSNFLFGDEKTVCPFCHGILSDMRVTADRTAAAGPSDINHPNSGRNYRTGARTADDVLNGQLRDRGVGQAGRQRLTGGNAAERDIAERNGAGRNVWNRQVPDADFVSVNGRRMQIKGRITEIEHHEVFYDKKHKILNSFLRGEPYQFAHQTQEWTVRVENITEGLPTQTTDVCFYGNYMGRFHVGDEVLIRSKNAGDRRIGMAVYDVNTDSQIKPGLQLPAWFIRMTVITAVLLIAMAVAAIVWFFASGMAAALASALIVPLIIVAAIIYMVIRPFRGRRRFYR